MAGFGWTGWLEPTELVPDGVSELLQGDESLCAAEPRILAHMNADHGDALDSCAEHLLDLPGEGWEMTDIDAEGFDLWRAGQIARLSFESPISHAADARRALASLVNKARNPPA